MFKIGMRTIVQTNFFYRLPDGRWAVNSNEGVRIGDFATENEARNFYARYLRDQGMGDYYSDEDV